MASSGQSLCFVQSPCEDEYVGMMKKAYGVDMHLKQRFTLARVFEQACKKLRINQDSAESMSQVEFRLLSQIDDFDERQESLHAVR